MLDLASGKSLRDRPAAEAGAGSGASYWRGGLVLAVTSAVLFLLGTRHGIGIWPDSTRYMGLDPNPYDAPLYAWVLQTIAVTGVPIEFGAKLIGLLLVSANTFLIWWMVVAATRRYVLAGMGTALIVFSPHFVGLHSLAMSEPLLIFGVLITLLLLVRFVETEKRIWLIGCAVAIGVTALARFTAVPLGAAVASVLVIAPHRQRAQRFVDAGLVAAISGAVFVIWAVGARVTTGHALGRDFALYGNLDSSHWLAALNAVSALLMPAQIPLAVRVALLLFTVAGGAYLCINPWRRGQRGNLQIGAETLTLVLALFFAFYIAFVILAVQIEANLFLTGRYAFPLYVTTAMLLTVTLGGVAPTGRGARYLCRTFVGLAAVILAMHVVRTADRTRAAYQDGIGYASLSWTTSPTVRAVSKLPDSTSIFSNGADAIGYLLRRPANYIPSRFAPRTGVDNPANPFEKQVQDLRDQLALGNAFVVFFDRIDWRFYHASEEDLQKLLNLRLVDSESDGRVYALQ